MPVNLDGDKTLFNRAFITLLLAFPYSKHLGPTRRANTLCGWSLILQRNLLRIFYSYLLPALETIRLQLALPPFWHCLKLYYYYTQAVKTSAPVQPEASKQLAKDLVRLPLFCFRVEA